MSKQYPEGTSSRHATVRLPKDLVDAIEGFLETDTAKKMGFLHITDVATEAVRELLRERGFYPQLPVLEHFNLNEQGVMILDRSIEPPKGKLIEVYFKPMPDDTLKVFCEYDETDRCRHIDFALDLPEVQEIIRKHNWKTK